ncbi:hypothetical protein OGAPHI_007079 [Ogataea philodendri]|uniref:peptidylprolyl isomerase n=1 Tax=Ogataea philodendri TaxID=1378263 RepID=A0A9P8NV89_9ASCO|nr:uncharacterized protein OGAPHI_007079 [Ogataea philodendri]KAH3660493.1 hypothetical protein OGAPHI_007079 [Ogataea philodendri]
MGLFAYLDIRVGNKDLGRVVAELSTDLAPKSCKNFLDLCRSKSYNNTCFHRVIRNFMIQAGDTDHKIIDIKNYPPPDLGKGGKSSFLSEYFEDENKVAIDKAFLLCMANQGTKDTNGSQFFISTTPSPHLSGKHSVFGKIIHGKSIIRELEKTPVISSKNSDPQAWIPAADNIALIYDCGEWKEGDYLFCYNACTDRIGGDIYEEYPDDNDENELDLEDPKKTLQAATTIKESATLLFKASRLDDSRLKYKKALRYCNELIPDQDSNPEYYKKFLDLKKTLYLNLALIELNLKNYQGTIDYCGYLLEMDSDVTLTRTQTSKTLYRLGKAYHGLKNFEVSLEFLQKASLINPDDQTVKSEMASVKKLVEDQKQTERQRFAKFFS